MKSFDGDKTKLGNAEKFFLELLTLPKYVAEKYLLFYLQALIMFINFYCKHTWPPAKGHIFLYREKVRLVLCFKQQNQQYKYKFRRRCLMS